MKQPYEIGILRDGSNHLNQRLCGLHGSLEKAFSSGR